MAPFRFLRNLYTTNTDKHDNVAFDCIDYLLSRLSLLLACPLPQNTTRTLLTCCKVFLYFQKLELGPFVYIHALGFSFDLSFSCTHIRRLYRQVFFLSCTRAIDCVLEYTRPQHLGRRNNRFFKFFTCFGFSLTFLPISFTY